MQNNKPKVIYSMQYAIQMKLLGHKILTTMPNPKNNKYQCWIFEDDQTFDSDLHRIIEEGRKSHG